MNKKSQVLYGALAVIVVSVVISVLMDTGIINSSVANAQSSDTSIETRVNRLEGRESVRELLISYGRIFDAHDLVGYSHLFARDGVWEGGIGSATGPNGILNMLNTMFSKIPPSSYKNSFHIMSNMDINVTGPEAATAWSRWTYFVDSPGIGPKMDRSGHYQDILETESGQWKFKHRFTVTELPTLNSMPNDIWQHKYKKSNEK